jgi:DNA-binding FadR family transcriptional regulator
MAHEHEHEARLASPPDGITRGRTKADLIAATVEQAILNREYATGDVVGSETAFAARFSASRPIVREGPGGGLVVGRPNADPVIAAASRYLEYSGVKAEDLLRARLALELACVEELAASMTEEKSLRLRREIEEERQSGSSLVGPMPRGEAFHALLAELTGNSALVLFVPVLARLSTRAYSRRIRPAESVYVRLAPDVLHAHEMIAEAVASGDADLAQLRVRKHLAALSEYCDIPDGADAAPAQP